MANYGKSGYDVLIKLLLVGDSGSGKSNMLLNFTDKAFSPSFVTTIGIDFKIKTVDIKGKKVKLQIWDTAGQERFRTITSAYYRGAMGILIVYSINDATSFSNVKTWLSNIQAHGNDKVKLMLVGNKCDDEEHRIVTKEQGMEFAYSYNINKSPTNPELTFMEVSAKDGTNIDSAFMQLSSLVLDDILLAKETSIETNDKVNFDKKSKKSCC